MTGRKIIALMDDNTVFQSSVNYAFDLFGASGSLIVAAFISDKSADIQKRRVIISQLQEKYSNSPSTKLIIRSENGLKPSDLSREIRYTDLIIHHSTQSEADKLQHLPANFTKLLVQSKVPLLIVPDDLSDIKEVFLTCDGSVESIKSIKQFCVLMSDFCRANKVTLLEFNHDVMQFQPSEEKLLIEYLKQHCNNLGIYKISNESPDKILKLINFNKNAMVVSGTLQALGKSIRELPALTNRLILVEKTPGFFGGY
jgi:hypothetical protein